MKLLSALDWLAQKRHSEIDAILLGIAVWFTFTYRHMQWWQQGLVLGGSLWLAEALNINVRKFAASTRAANEETRRLDDL